jgi:choline kinase
VSTQVAILAAGLGTRLGRPFPKPLTPLTSGQSIIERQITYLREALGDDTLITVVVGFKHDLIMEAAPDVLFAYNELFDQTNTCKSLLKALTLSPAGGLMWLNGDVVFHPELIPSLLPEIEKGDSFVSVNTASVAEEEVKYTLDGEGYIAELSKQVVNGLGEAVGINYVSEADKATLAGCLDRCSPDDYFERGIELAIAEHGQRWRAVDISAYDCVEVDFEEDLANANALLADASPQRA